MGRNHRGTAPSGPGGPGGCSVGELMGKMRTRRSLIPATAVASYLTVAVGGAARAFAGLSATAERWLDLGYRAAALAVAGAALAALVSGGRGRWLDRPVAGLGLAGLALGGAYILLAAPASPYLGVAMAFVATWLLAATVSGGEHPYHSRLSMFRSQWQVPLYAAVATYVVTSLGSYLKELGSEAACGGWPLCDGLLTGPLTAVDAAHLAHRTAAALAGLFLLYTVWFVWKKHYLRPGLLVLTAISVILFTTQVLLGAQAARFSLTAAGSFAHLAIATALVSTLVALAVVGYYAPSLPSIAGGSAAAAALPGVAVRPWREVARDYFVTMKPRIVVLLLITGYCAMWVAAGGAPDLWLTLVTMVGLGLSCGAANAINMWYDRDIDAVMKRTRKRPIPAGRLTPEQVLSFGILTGTVSFILLAAAVNLLTALLSLAGLLFYVCIYTMWLKRSTDQNIVIGGAAGAVPPLVGWAAVTGEMSWAAWLMFLIIFVWTPPHFWALALFRNEDYRRAGVPMLPVVRGEMNTKWQILLYSVALIPTTAALYLTGTVGEVYLGVSLLLSVLYLAVNAVLLRERLPAYRWAKRSFVLSLCWLAFIFLFMVLDVRG